MPFAAWHMEQIAREQLYNMLSWKIGVDRGYDFSVGKHNKYIQKYLSPEEWDLLMKTYCMDSLENCWLALGSAHVLFRQVSKYVATHFDFVYPDYDQQITNYISRNKEAFCIW